MDYFSLELEETVTRMIRKESALVWDDFKENGFEDVSTQSLPGEMFKTAYFLGFRAALLDVLGKEVGQKL